MVRWLFKTEPGEYSFDDLLREKETVWTGVSAAPALANLRQSRKGDRVFIYHTGDEKAIVGLAQLVSDPYPDPEAPELNDKGEPKVPIVRLKPLKRVPNVVTLSTIKSDARFAQWAFVRQSRLSIVPMPGTLSKALERLAGL
jgi:predicted RNA-binding protein with PUA-like domain